MLWRSLFRTVQAPPPLPANAHAVIEENILTGARFNSVTWLPVQPVAERPTVVVVGDSWADPWDMGFSCWPSILAAELSWSCVNVARGGSVIGETRAQLRRAHKFLASESSGPPRWLVVHSGGNDVLHALLSPLFFLLWLDVLRLLATQHGVLRRPDGRRPPTWSFCRRSEKSGIRIHAPESTQP
jgi:hypothetical protein